MRDILFYAGFGCWLALCWPGQAQAVPASTVQINPIKIQKTKKKTASVHRTWGIGTAIGGGFSYNVIPTDNPPSVRLGPQGDIFTLELRLFLEHGASTDIYTQVGNTMAGVIIAAIPKMPDEEGVLLFLSLGVLYNWNLGWDTFKILIGVGPEIGGDIGVAGRFEQTRPVKAYVRLSTRVGVEWLFQQKRFGLQLMLRTFYEPFGYAS